jgi:amino acid adenylation domain-containing protein
MENRYPIPAGDFVPLKAENIEYSIPELFEEAVVRFNDRVAVKDGEKTLSFNQLNESANQIAWALVRRLGEKNQPVAVFLEHGIEPIIACLAALKAGKIAVMLDPSHPIERTTHILQDVQAKGLITSGRNRCQAEAAVGGEGWVIDADELDPGLSTENLGLGLPAEALAQVVYTSGSTGVPKGLFKTHRFVLHEATQRANATGLAPADRWVLSHNVAANAAVRQIVGCLLTGALIVPFDIKKLGVDEFARFLRRERITIYHGFSSTFRALAGNLSEEERFSALRLLILSGETISKSDLDLYKKHFSSSAVLMLSYGSTETGMICTRFVDRDGETEGSVVPVGYVTEGKTVLLLDENGDPIASGEVGEIAVRSRHLAGGYWRNPELTRRKFLPDPDGGDQRICLTGDLGRFLSDGCLVHLGRKDNLVKIRGYRVGISEVEAALLEHENVKEAAVTVWDRSGGDKFLAAYVAPRTERGPTVTELSAFLRTKLADYMVPATFTFLQSFPRVNGKIDRRSLPRPQRTRPDFDHAYVPAANNVEERLVQIWEEVLDIRPIGIHDNFFDLGGHSLAATRVVSQIIKKFELELPLLSLFQSPTVAQMARVIAENQTKNIDGENLRRILTELESLSDQDAQKLFAEGGKS